jgi:hypothetical protein
MLPQQQQQQQCQLIWQMVMVVVVVWIVRTIFEQFIEYGTYSKLNQWLQALRQTNVYMQTTINGAHTSELQNGHFTIAGIE